jgi:exopolyphosphatase/pppGpp-phosphohydrolase
LAIRRRPTFVSITPAATLAVVDLGSNSFRLEIGRVEGDQIYRLDTSMHRVASKPRR